MQKRGQITIFIILGFVIIIAVSFIYYAGNITELEKTKIEVKKLEEIPFTIQGFENFLEICLRNIAEEGITFISQRGGYFNLPRLLKQHIISMKILAYFLN